ncbi:hypothetical protein AC622_06910 [Bacillus sp. FJAT-27916]|uniref:hypothetical protein n=1 Tax=Bacillus sp. FJAT-27916 TaxID=1679169 RepID=UPI0006717435|nr:hypothetical protein [Bacillus sp. FJAT-27916]KMY44013.1 hypothetical protein AC622_06910 [Bacillus sp. FJAT-27916]
MRKMDEYTYDLYSKLEPAVEKIAYHDMGLTYEQFTKEDLDAITYELCKAPQDRSLDFWGYVSVVDQMDQNADWPDITKGIERVIHKYLKH